MLCQQGGGVLAFFRLRRAHGKPSRGRKSRCGLFACREGESINAVSDDGAVRIFDATLGELKSFSVKRTE